MFLGNKDKKMEEIIEDEGNNIGYYCEGWIDKQEAANWIIEEYDDSLEITTEDIEYMYMKEISKNAEDEAFPELWDCVLDFRRTEKEGYKKVTVYGEPTSW